MSLKVNGQTYSWGDVDVKIPGLVLVVQEISYDDEQDMDALYSAIEAAKAEWKAGPFGGRWPEIPGEDEFIPLPE